MSEHCAFIPGGHAPSGLLGWPSRPSQWEPPRAVEDWFTRVAQRLLHQCQLVVGGQSHKLLEIEFYLHGPDHPDPFVHRHPLQQTTGQWYFHRSGPKGNFRAGTFQGLDITCGDETSACGILIRALETPDGRLVEGPSCCVDYLLTSLGLKQVADLDRQLGSHGAPCSVWDLQAPIALQKVDDGDVSPMVRSARVGLTLKRADLAAPHLALDYFLRQYRYTTAQNRLKKGTPLFILALVQRGFSAEEIHNLLGTSLQRIRTYLRDFAEGQNLTEITPFVGQDLSPRRLCQLHGYWYAQQKTRDT